MKAYEYYRLHENMYNPDKGETDSTKLGLTQDIHWKPYEINVGEKGTTINISKPTYCSYQKPEIVKTIHNIVNCHVPMIHDQQNRIAIADNDSGNTKLFDLIKLKSLKTIPLKVSDSYDYNSSTFKFFPDQQVFASVTSITKYYNKINIYTEQIINTFSKNEQTITLWKCKTYEPNTEITIPSDEHVGAMAFSSYGHMFAAAINDKIKISYNTLKDSKKSDSWDVESGKMIHATNIMFAPNGAQLFAQDTMEVKILSTYNAGLIGTIKLSHSSPICKFAFNFGPEQKFAIIQDMVDYSGLKPLASLKLYSLKLNNNNYQPPEEVDQSLEVIGNFQKSIDPFMGQLYGGMAVYDEILMIGDTPESC